MLQLLDARAGRARRGDDSRDALVAHARRSARSRAGRSCSARRAAAARRGPRRTRRARGRSVRNRPSRSLFGGVEHVHEQPRPLEMGQELVAEAGSLRGAFDQPRHVRDRELPLVRAVDDAEDGLERRERVVGDLRLRVRDAPEQRGLARVRQSRRAPRRRRASGAGRCRARRPGARSRQSGASAGSASRSGHFRARPGRRGQRRTGCSGSSGRRRARRPESRICVPTGTRTSTVSPSAPCFRLPRPLPPLPARRYLDPPERGEVAKRRICDHDDVAAAASVAAVGPAPRDVLLATEAERAVAAAPRFDVQRRPVVEHGQPRARPTRREASLAPTG